MNAVGVYKRREPEKTPLYKIVFNYYEALILVHPPISSLET